MLFSLTFFMSTPSSSFSMTLSMPFSKNDHLKCDQSVPPNDIGSVPAITNSRFSEVILVRRLGHGGRHDVKGRSGEAWSKERKSTVWSMMLSVSIERDARKESPKNNERECVFFRLDSNAAPRVTPWDLQAKK